ncbi:hypothetical protein RRG08_061716 [Elysia crispata]|uniref:Uncharacterized protein n=1 Tax=Elysia crispata TaxID=231223 RepID=A0AAE0ZZI1_9GAST|nr:hypothetical protein RRG08_061716 [Elysia crispata]
MLVNRVAQSMLREKFQAVRFPDMSSSSGKTSFRVTKVFGVSTSVLSCLNISASEFSAKVPVFCVVCTFQYQSFRYQYQCFVLFEHFSIRVVGVSTSVLCCLNISASEFSA